MEAAETLSGPVLSQDDEETRDGEVVCRIVFEEYLSKWVQIATTRAGYSTAEDPPDEQIERPEKVAAHYGVPGSETNQLVKGLDKTFKDYGPTPKSSKKRNSRQTRVEQMRRIYLLCGSPDRAAPRGPTLSGPVPDAERQECWESEVDKLVAWTDSLSFEELDGPELTRKDSEHSTAQ